MLQKIETSRLDFLERELMELRKRVADLEIELCNKDSLIAQQDSVIHRFTANLRSQRIHRRNFSALAESSQFDIQGVPESPCQARHVRSTNTVHERQSSQVRDLIDEQQAQIQRLIQDLGQCRID